ncbi:8538_t:CDS:2, partial [Racocetra persica]
NYELPEENQASNFKFITKLGEPTKHDMWHVSKISDYNGIVDADCVKNLGDQREVWPNLR